MKPSQVTTTYDGRYAEVYDDTFLHASWTRPSLEFQLDLIRHHLTAGGEWLDVACGTGYVLSRFPEVVRTGLDYSESMLAQARARNPGVAFVQRNYRAPCPEWNGRFSLVTCMWWAYCLAETMAEVRTLVARLAEWTAPDGTVLLPLCNVNKFDSHNIKLPYIDPKVPGRCMITGFVWAWIQEDGERHDDVVTPQVEHMILMFSQHFEDVQVVTAPAEQVGEGWLVQDVLVARRKRTEPLTGDLHPAGDGPVPGKLEWNLAVNGRALATLAYPEFRDLAAVRVTLDAVEGNDPWIVQVNKAGFAVRAGARYRLAFRARADAPRTVAVGVSHGAVPWSSLGFYGEFPLTADWTSHESEFVATDDGIRSRVHFDLATSLVPVELANVRLEEIAPPPAA